MSARLVHSVDQLSAVAGTLQPHGSMTVTLSREDMTELLDVTAAVERVRALHERDGEGFCAVCDYMTPHPCPTLRALDDRHE